MQNNGIAWQFPSKIIEEIILPFKFDTPLLVSLSALVHGLLCITC